MWFYSFVFFPLISLIYLVMIIVGLIYSYMGLVQLAAARRKKDHSKAKGGLVGLTVAIVIITLASYVYFKLTWFW